MSVAEAFTDEELTAWLDGEADADLRMRIDAAAGPDLDGRLAALRIDLESVRDGFAMLLDAAPPAPKAVEQGSRWRRISWRSCCAAAVAFACVALGAVVAETVREDPLSDWRGYAAAYHRLYVAETLGAAGDDAARSAALAQVADRLGKSIAPSDLDVDGLTLRRAQILGFEGAPLAQIAFTAVDGAPIALCVIARPGAAPQPIETTTMMGMAAARWAGDGYEFLLIGGGDRKLIAAAADAFADAL